MDTYLSKIQITNFRNLQSIPLVFSKKINCIFGLNGNGKTNLLEAIYFLTNKKSFKKKTKFPQLLSMDCEKAEIYFNSLYHQEEDHTLSGKINDLKSEWYLDNKIYKSKPKIKSVFINPFDSFQFHNSSSFRRKLMDDLFSLLSDKYKKILSNYNNSLKFRNSLLQKKPTKYIEQINALDEQFILLNIEILKMRVEFLNNLNDIISKTFKDIFSEEHHLSLKYETKFEINFESVKRILKENFQKDLILGNTSYSSHRDDYIFIFDGFNSYEYCSLGQQKMSFLSLLFAYIELFRYKLISYPLVLIDDVSGELDSVRWGNLISYLDLKNFQVFITTANENFKSELLKLQGVKNFLIENGEIKEF